MEFFNIENLSNIIQSLSIEDQNDVFNWAVINQENFVVNIIIWDGIQPWSPPEGHTVVKIVDSEVDIGWKYVNGEFSNS